MWALFAILSIYALWIISASTAFVLLCIVAIKTQLWGLFLAPLWVLPLYGLWKYLKRNR